MRNTWELCVACLRVARFSNAGLAHRLKILGRANQIRVHNLLYLFALLLLLPSLVFAQVNTGTLTGTVRDTSGAVVPDAMVTVRNTATGATRVVQTGNDGVYTVPGLAPSLYDVTISKTGFADYKTQATITVGSHVTLDAGLSVSQVSTTVEVVAAPGGGAEINTQTQEVSQIVTPQQIENLPSLTRNPYDFVALAGNVSGGDKSMSSNNPQLANGGGQNTTDYRGVGFSINGQRLSDTEVLLDGAENLNIFDNTIALLIPQDSVQEFRVITNNFDAQYGRAAGGVVNVATKSGTDNYHGDAWEFNRLSAYTANTFDNNASGAPKGQYTRNQFGYDIGGPIKKDKLFFYQSTEWLRVRSNASVLALVPDPAFLKLTAPVVQSWFATYGPQTFAPVGVIAAGNPSLKANTAATCAATTPPTPAPCGTFSTAVPTGTPVFDVVNYIAPQDAGGDTPQNTYFLTGRLDYNLGSNTQLFFRYGRESLATLPGGLFASPYSQYDVGETIYNNNFLLSVIHTFSSNVLSTTRLSFFRDDEAYQFNTSLQNTPELILWNINLGSVTIAGQPVQFPGLFAQNTGSGGLPFGGPQNTIQINEDVSWLRGKHNMRYGGQVNYIQLNRGYGAYAQAVESLGKGNVGNGLDNMLVGQLYQFEKAINPAGQFPCAVTSYSGPSSGNMTLAPNCTLLGKYPISDPSFNRSDRYRDWALYAEDSWRVTPKFTFNYGLRYEHFGIQHNNNPNLDSNFYFGPGASFYQQVAAGSVQTVPNSPIGALWKPRWGTAGPRIGFAYDVFGTGKTVVRGGYGITYDRNFGNVTFNVIQNVPNSATVTILNTPLVVPNAGPFAGTGPTAATCGATPSVASGCGLPPVSPRNIDQNIQVETVQFWGATLEHRLGAKALIALDYNGSHGVHLYDIKNINPIGGGQVYLGQPLVTADPTNPACSATSPCLTRPNPFFTAINNRGTNGFSHYNSLNLRFETQELGHTGLFITSNYTYAHALDNLSSTFSESNGNGSFNLGYLDPTNVWLDYGSADFDVRHRLALAITWTEPFLKGPKGVLNEVGGGWSLSPIFTARTGIPFSVFDSTNGLQFTPRYVPTTAISGTATGAGVDSGAPNLFNLLSLPAANTFNNPVLGISDFGPFPSNMTARNEFGGPGAWNFDVAVAKNFFLTERFSLEFRAEGYDIFNHVNMYVVASAADANGVTGPIVITGKKGGLGIGNNEGVNHDERRFGQFALRLHF
jgi:outer membrane receptor protein involved in Fe transport